MLDNTPPHRQSFNYDSDEELIEEIALVEHDEPPLDDDDELEMEEVTMAELENRLMHAENRESDDEAEIEDQQRIANIKDEALFTFRKHKQPVFACGFHPQRDWAVTGSQDDLAYVWNISTGEVLYEINEHRDTITEAHFSHDGSYLVTGDLAGELRVYKVSEQREDRPILSKVWEYSMSDMTWLFWHRAAHVLIGGSDNGDVYVWRIPGGDCKILPGQDERCEAGDLSNDGKKLLTAYINGVIKLWDLKTCQVLMEVNKQHTLAFGDITHAIVACDRDSPFYLCAEGGGKMLFCTNNGPVNSVQCEHGIECVAFAPPTAELKLVACGSLEGNITIWDYSKYAVRTVCENPLPNDGVLRLKWLNDYTLLAATSQGNLVAYDARTGVLKFTLTGHYYDIYEFVYKPEENLLLSVSEDTTAKIFKVPSLGE
ncbi:angio-associated migratory cell protein [Scaptodrosophila lebanonensis]|uniref:Angio-associated migratory cell protein n=1 Tax=Drosophila lebanonensis TaxID=7225 RepID=A0A6J2TK61_DROLE|nr:angio-associated migratory cell protein [Scaptodrosophila lebanonensis]